MHVDNRFADPYREPPDPALQLYQAARHAANLALIAWLNTGPDAVDIALEVDGSVAILRQLASLAGGAA